MANFQIENSRVGQLNVHGDNISNENRRTEKPGHRWWTLFLSIYGVVGTTVSVVGLLISLYIMHLQYGWWFFGF